MLPRRRTFDLRARAEVWLGWRVASRRFRRAARCRRRQIQSSQCAARAPREGPFLVPEKFTFHQGLGNGGAIHGHERWVAGAELMDGARRQFFARAAFARNQNGSAGGRDHGDQAHDLLHFGGTAHQASQHAQIAQAAMRNFQLPLAFVPLHAIAQFHLQPLGIDGFFQKVVSAQLGGFHRFFNGALAGEHDKADTGSRRHGFGAAAPCPSLPACADRK